MKALAFVKRHPVALSVGALGIVGAGWAIYAATQAANTTPGGSTTVTPASGGSTSTGTSTGTSTTTSTGAQNEGGTTASQAVTGSGDASTMTQGVFRGVGGARVASNTFR